MSLSELRSVARGWRWGRPAYGAAKTISSEAEFDTDFARSSWARVTRGVLQESLVVPLARLVASPSAIGVDRLAAVPRPAVLCANHSSHLDTSVLLAALPPVWRDRLVVGAAADYFFKDRVRGRLAAVGLGAFPVERHRASATSAKLAVRLVREGWSCLLFPEGTRSEDGWLSELKPGAAFIACKAGAPIVPIWIHGTEHLMPRGSSRPRRGRVEVYFGHALYPACGESPRDLTVRLAASMAQLSAEAVSGWYASMRSSGESPYGPDASRWRRVWERGEAPARPSSDWE